tara:strand:- start:43 stop:864 length:822 start_codon:yes stop_codon:yes gene_type:complete
MKKLILLLLFIPLVSIGQEIESSLELVKKGKFSIGLNVNQNTLKGYQWTTVNANGESTIINRGVENETIAHNIFGNDNSILNVNFNYKFSNKSLIGFDVGHSLGNKKNTSLGLIYGYDINEKLTAKISYGFWNLSSDIDFYLEQKRINNNRIFNEYFIDKSRNNYGGISLTYNLGRFSPEIGFKLFRLKTYYSSNEYEYNEATNLYEAPTQAGIGEFITNIGMPSFGIIYHFYPSKNKAIKKLTQAKNALELELITQEEYDKIYIKYFKYTKN